MLGYKGSGKSSTGNTLLGLKTFSGSADQRIKASNTCINNKMYTVLDTPAVSSKDDVDNILFEVDQKYKSEEKYYFLVMRIGRVQPEEISLWKEVLEVGRVRFLSRSDVIFTYANALSIEESNQGTMTIQEYVGQNSSLKSLINTNYLKYFSVDNNAWSVEQKLEFKYELLASRTGSTTIINTTVSVSNASLCKRCVIYSIFLIICALIIIFVPIIAVYMLCGENICFVNLNLLKKNKSIYRKVVLLIL